MAQVSSPAIPPFIHPDEVRPLLAHLVSGDVARTAGGWFSALADPTRVRILQALALSAEWCVGDLALALGISVSALSHQLHYLRARGVVTRRKDGRVVFYRLADEHVRHVLRDALAHLAEPG